MTQARAVIRNHRGTMLLEVAREHDGDCYWDERVKAWQLFKKT